MRIGELAGLAGFSTRAIRHYHRVGLLPEPARRANGYREYALADAVALARVRRLAEVGLSLDEAGGEPSEQAPVSPELALLGHGHPAPPAQLTGRSGGECSPALLPFTFSRLSFPGIIRRDMAGTAA